MTVLVFLIVMEEKSGFYDFIPVLLLLHNTVVPPLNDMFTII